jgi:hypothetical protein
MNSRLWLCLIGLLVAGVASYFTVSGGGVVKWNDKAVALITRCEKSVDLLEPAIRPYFEGREIDDERVDKAFQVYQAEVEIATRELGWLTPPNDPDCRGMQDALIAYVELQKTILEELSALLETMKASNPPAEEDVESVRETLKDLERREDIVHQKLVARQRVVAAKFNMKLR